MIQLLYSQLARSRRLYYQRRPHLRRRLAAPVISVGNLTVGGSGKTPLTGEIARMLIEMGERPAILSRGYGRARTSDGAVIVSDGRQITSDCAHAGDEPMMLARLVPGASVVVCPDRYLAGRVAESKLASTVHILDDGFQHFQLMRDVDLLVAPPEDFSDTRTLPFGRFREPLEAACAADALLVPVDDTIVGEDAAPGQMGERLKVAPAFGFQRRIEAPETARRVFAFAGIAKPLRFFDELERAGWVIAGRQAFSDHHRYSSREIDQLARSAREAGADALATTSKDIARLPSQTVGGLPIVDVPLQISIDAAFRQWLADRLAKARAA